MVIVVLPFGVHLRHLRDQRETHGFPLCGLIEYACVLFSRRLRRWRRGIQQAVLSRRERQVVVSVVLWFVCDYLREICWVPFVLIDWVLLREYSPADSAEDAEECSKLYYFAEKDRLFEVKAVLLFWGFICVNLRDLRETLGFRLCNISWVLLCEYSPADYADHAEGMQQAALSRRERQLVANFVLGLL